MKKEKQDHVRAQIERLRCDAELHRAIANEMYAQAAILESELKKTEDRFLRIGRHRCCNDNSGRR